MIITEESLLRTNCEDVLPEEVDEIINKLEEELQLSEKNGAPGVGLAAPQIGIFKKAAIIRVSDISVNLINPKIIKSYDEFIFSGEGCLSFPGLFKERKGFNQIVVKNGIDPVSFIATGLFAVVIQHEIEHLKGILLVDF